MVVIPTGSGQLTAEFLVLTPPVLIKTNSMWRSITRSVILVKSSHCGAERAEPKGVDRPQFSGVSTPTAMSRQALKMMPLWKQRVGPQFLDVRK